MNKKILQVVLGLFAIAVLIALGVDAAQASPNIQADKVAHGRYLTQVAGCVTCHTPYQPQIDLSKPELIKPDDLLKLGFSERDVLDTSARLMAGGRPFDLGPNGVWHSLNLTPDKETGLGNWTDDEIKIAIRTGKTKEGYVLFPLMPYPHFNGMADADVDAIVAYLRTIPAVTNLVPHNPVIPNLQPLPLRNGITAPEPENTGPRGKYLVDSVLPCNDCHTPVDAATGQPVMSKYLGGGQPFEGPWGIVYGGNITPHEKGLAKWTDADIRRVLASGVRPDGRRLVVMPWQDYAQLTDADGRAVVDYLRHGVPAVDNEVPAAALKPEFVKMVSAPAPAAPANTATYIVIGVIALIVVVLGAFFLMRRSTAAK